MTNVIPFKKPESTEGNEKCSFCGTKRKDTKKMFSNGQGKFICASCVQTAKKRIEEEDAVHSE